MKRFALLLPILSTLSLPALSQHSQPVLVQTSGSGTTIYAPANGFDYTHHTNYTMQIRSLTAKWNLRTLMGEPVVDGVFKWEAGKGTPIDYLDYRDFVLLECSPKKSTGYLVYIALMPTVPKAGEGYGLNVPGSPSWKDVFCTRSGESMTTKVPGFDAKTAYDIWKNGFYVTGVVLCRQGGNDGYLKPDGQQQEADRIANANQQKAKEKYRVLSNPFRLTVNDNDTVLTDKIRPLADLHPFLKDAKFLINSVNTGESPNASSSSSPDEGVTVTEGWNTIYIAIYADEFVLRKKVKVFYKKRAASRVTLLSDNFDDGILDERWEDKGYKSNYARGGETDGHLFMYQGGERTHVYIRTKPLQADPDKKLIIQFTSRLLRSSSCYYAWVVIHDNYQVRFRKKCDEPEKVRLEWDLKNGEINCYTDGELVYSDKKEYYRDADGLVQPGFGCSDFQRLEIDDIEIFQE